MALKPEAGIGDEEDEDDHSSDAGQDVPLVLVPPGEEAGDGDGPHLGGVPPQTLGHDEPVEIGADGQAQGGPAHLGHAGEIGQAGQTHEQVTAHVRGLGTHGGDDGAQLPAAQVELVGAVAPALAAAVDPHQHHGHQIDHDGQQDADLGC